MISHHTMCLPTPEVPGRRLTPWGDPTPSYPAWPSLPPWAQPVYVPVWQPTPRIWA